MTSGFKFEIAYRAGKKHNDADALSRLVISPDEPIRVKDPDGNMINLEDVVELGGHKRDLGEQNRREKISDDSLEDPIPITPIVASISDREDTGRWTEKIEMEEEIDADLPYETLGERQLSHLVAVQGQDSAWTKAKKGNSHGVDQSKIFKTLVSPHLVHLWKDGQDLWRMFVEEQNKDAECKKYRSRYEEEGGPFPLHKGAQVVVEEGMVYILIRSKEDSSVIDRQVLFIPASLKVQVCRMYHGELPMGHMDYKKTLQRISRLYYWQGMATDIRRYILQCQVCQRRNQEELSFQGPLHSWTPSRPFEIVGADVLVLPLTHSKKKYVWVAVDYLTRYVEASILSGVPTAEEVMDLFLRKIILRHGCIGTLVTDPGSEFINSIAQDVCERLYVKHVSTPTDDHRANGLCERFMRTLQLILSKETGTVETIKHWDQLFDAAIFAYNTAYQVAIQGTPFFYRYGCDAVLPPDRWVFQYQASILKSQKELEPKTDFMKRFEKSWDRAKEATMKAVEARRKLHEKRCKEISFEIGDQVWVYIPEIFSAGVHRKLLFKWHGPYHVVGIEREGLLYQVRTERGRKVQQLFHVRRLKPYVPFTSPPEEQVALNEEGEVVPLEIEDLTPSSARVESALWRKEQRAQEMGTITRVYDLDPYPARQPTRVEQQLIGKMFEDEEGRWIVRSVSYDHNMGRMVAYYERILTKEGVVVPAGEVEYSSWEEVYDWIVISAPKIHAKGAGGGARRSR